MVKILCENSACKCTQSHLHLFARIYKYLHSFYIFDTFSHVISRVCKYLHKGERTCTFNVFARVCTCLHAFARVCTLCTCLHALYVFARFARVCTLCTCLHACAELWRKPVRATRFIVVTRDAAVFHPVE